MNDTAVVKLRTSPPGEGKRMISAMDWKKLLLPLILVAGGAIRVALGQPSTGYLLAILVPLALFAFFLIYVLLRRRNAKMFLSGSEIGVAGAFGTRKTVPLSSVDHLERVAAFVDTAKRTVKLLLAVAQDNKCLLRFAEADHLEPDGIEKLAAAANLEVRGDWNNPVEVDKLGRMFPGSISPPLALSGLVREHPSASIACGVASILVIISVVAVLAVVVGAIHN